MVEWVSFGAMCFEDIECGLAVGVFEGIGARGNDADVLWVDAVTDTALVIGEHTGWDGSVDLFVAEAVSDGEFSFDGNLGIAVAVGSSSGDVAGSFEAGHGAGLFVVGEGFHGVLRKGLPVVGTDCTM